MGHRGCGSDQGLGGGQNVRSPLALEQAEKENPNLYFAFFERDLSQLATQQLSVLIYHPTRCFGIGLKVRTKFFLLLHFGWHFAGGAF